MTQPDLLPHAEAIIDRLESADLVVGDHVAPKSPNGQIVAPCVVLYLLPGGQQSGNLGQVDVDAWLPFQLTCVGRMAAQAMNTADIAHQALTGTPLEITDRHIASIRRNGFGARAERDDDVTPPLFYVPVQYRLWTLNAPVAS